MRHVKVFEGTVNGTKYTNPKEYNKAVQAALVEGKPYSCSWSYIDKTVPDPQVVEPQQPTNQQQTRSTLIDRLYDAGLMPLTHEQIDEISGSDSKTSKYVWPLFSMNEAQWDKFIKCLWDNFTADEIKEYLDILRKERSRISNDIKENILAKAKLKKILQNAQHCAYQNKMAYDTLTKEALELETKLADINRKRKSFEMDLVRCEKKIGEVEPKVGIVSNADSILKTDHMFAKEAIERLEVSLNNQPNKPVKPTIQMEQREKPNWEKLIEELHNGY